MNWINWQGLQPILFENIIFFIDDYCRKKSIYAIRVPGGTVGEIRVDETNKVVGIVIDTGYVVKTYPENINVLLQEYVGEEIKLNI